MLIVGLVSSLCFICQHKITIVAMYLIERPKIYAVTWF